MAHRDVSWRDLLPHEWALVWYCLLQWNCARCKTAHAVVQHVTTERLDRIVTRMSLLDDRPSISKTTGRDKLVAYLLFLRQNMYTCLQRRYFDGGTQKVRFPLLLRDEGALPLGFGDRR